MISRIYAILREWELYLDQPTVENQEHCLFMQTAHSISEIIIVDATDNDAMGKNKTDIRTAIYEHLFNIQWQMAIHPAVY